MGPRKLIALMLFVSCFAGSEVLSQEEPPAEAISYSNPFDALEGFWEVRLGYRTRNDPYERDLSLGETRLQLEWQSGGDETFFRICGNMVDDYLAYRDGRRPVRLEQGVGFFDLREFYLSFAPIDPLEIRAGRQILDWGTGDLLFINDLFPKDWNSFYLGRDESFLRAPSDALKSVIRTEFADLDLVFTPRFDADRHLDARRLSYYN
ncbi:MAG: hypothetical protein KJ645_12905 [Planctomycetes bacterium]|nr:hypothetical protein [Planctomycetota bacterium]